MMRPAPATQATWYQASWLSWPAWRIDWPMAWPSPRDEPTSCGSVPVERRNPATATSRKATGSRNTKVRNAMWPASTGALRRQ